MANGDVGGGRPAVSIILPTYNRAKFLPQAFESIRSQEFGDWELIVVDDGSTDDTREVVAGLSAGLGRPVRYVRQENQGAYGARNTGLDLARGEYVAFFDSDDVWLPHHLADCVSALEAGPEVDWVYGACRVEDLVTNRVLEPSTFYVNGKPRAFLGLKGRSAGPARVLDDPDTLRTMLAHGGLFCGLQNSVIRRRVFEGRRFCTRYRNEAEDVVMAIRLLAAGGRFAYIDNVHVRYRIHPGNSCATGAGSVEKRLKVYDALFQAWGGLRAEVQFTPPQRRAFERGLSAVYFWHYGYHLLWENGRGQEALAAFRRALRLWPWSLRCWKTYCLAALKVRLGWGSGGSRAGRAGVKPEAGPARRMPGGVAAGKGMGGDGPPERSGVGTA